MKSALIGQERHADWLKANEKKGVEQIGACDIVCLN